MIEAPLPADEFVQTKYRAPLGERVRVWWNNNVVNLTWINQLGRWWFRRQMLRDPSWYVSWHANIAMRLYDLQDRHSVFGNLPDGSLAKRTVFFDAGNFDFSMPEHRDFVAHDLLKLLFGFKDKEGDTLYLRAYGKPVEHSNPSYRAALSNYINSLGQSVLNSLQPKHEGVTRTPVN